MVIRKVIGLILCIALTFLTITFSMKNCMRRNLRIVTRGQNSQRCMSIETSCSDIENFPNVDIGGKTGGFDLGGANSSWEFGSFNCKSHPSTKEREDFEKQKLEETNIVKTDISWVDSLSDEELDRGIVELSKYCSKERSERFDLILKERTSNVRMVFENPANANNVWASLRTLDAFGIQYIDVITQQSTFDSAWRREVMSGAMGTQKWLTLQEQPDTITCLKALKKDGFRVLVSDIHESSKSVHDFDWGAQPTAIIMGNEDRGCSQTAKDLADDRFYIPMKGFVESLNLSVATAVLCAALESKEALKPNLTDLQKKRVLITWMTRTVSGSMSILRQGAGLTDLKGNLYNKIGQYTTKP